MIARQRARHHRGDCDRVIFRHGALLGGADGKNACLGRIDDRAEIVLVERSPDCCRELYEAIEGDGSAKLLQGDFLEKTPEEIGYFDSVIMNPPFCRGDDMRHIEHARKFLSPGGRLAAICAAGPRQIRKYTQEEAYEFHHLPPDSFKSEGTSVSTAIVIIDN